MLLNVIGNRWLSVCDYEKSYDRLSVDYNQNWLVHLHKVTDDLLDMLPEQVDGDILDIGCGTGYTTRFLENKYSENRIVAADISSGMLAQARQECKRTELVHQDMLEFLAGQEDVSAGLIVSGWAIGYSTPRKIIAEASRVLKSGGVLAFVVNYADTMQPVFYAFRHTMARFPDKVLKALNPKYPVDYPELEKMLNLSGFEYQYCREGRILIEGRECGSRKLEWLLNTGVLAGFDKVLPLQDNDEVAEFFEIKMNECEKPMEHHYIIYLGTKR